MKDRVTMGGAAIALGAYLTVLWAHALLPDTASFSLVMASMAAGMATCLLIAAWRREGSCHDRLPNDGAERISVPIGPCDYAGARIPPVDTLAARLRLVEAELHALEDQCLSEQALCGAMPLPFRPEFGR